MSNSKLIYNQFLIIILWMMDIWLVGFSLLDNS